MRVLACLLWALIRATLGGPVQLATWPELGANLVETTQDGAARPLFYHLPMYQHAPRPYDRRELFQPVPEKSPLPGGLAALLFPTMRDQQSGQETRVGPVDVWCGMDNISVRVDRLQARAWPTPSLFQLGSCQANNINPRFLYFDYKLTDCDGELKVVGGQLVYTFLLCYTPPPQGYVIRVLPLNLPIQCHYNRFHNSYKVGYVPQVQQTTFMKSIGSKLSYSLTVCNDQGQPVPPDHGFVLGEPVYFLARAEVLLPGERLYVDSCYTTSSKDPNSKPRLDIITNYGCMTDSRRMGSSSRFLQGGGSWLSFSVNSFVFTSVSQVLYLHCSMSVGLSTSHISKSCNYNKAVGRWEELQAAASVCSCCDSTCSDTHDPIKNTVSSPGWMFQQSAEVKPRTSLPSPSFQAEERIELTDEETYQRHKVHTLPWEIKIVHEENENADLKESAEREWRHSAAVSQQREEEEEEEETEGINLAREDISDKTRSDETWEDVPFSKNSVTDFPRAFSQSSTHSSGTIISARNSSFVTDYNASNPGPADNVSMVITSNSELCLNGDCGTLETLTGTIIELEPAGFLNVSESGESRLESDMSNPPVLSESVDTQFEEILGQAGDAANSEGLQDDDHVLHSLTLSGLELDPSGFKDLMFADESDFDSGVEGEALQPSQFTEAVLTQGHKDGWDSDLRPHSSGPWGSEETFLGSHSTVVVVTDAHQGSWSQMFDRDWVELVSGWG